MECTHETNEVAGPLCVLVPLAATRKHGQWLLYLALVEAASVFDTVVRCVPEFPHNAPEMSISNPQTVDSEAVLEFKDF